MGFEITAHATVGPNGHLEIDLPELQEGQRVELIVRARSETPKDRRGGFGAMPGELLYMSEDFDAPLEAFSKYQ